VGSSKLTLMHCPQHAGDKLVNSVALLNKRDKAGDTALVVDTMAEVGEYELLESVNLIL